MPVSLFLLSLGGIILLGVLGNFLFGRTKVPTPLILIALGIILGPATGWVRSDAFGAVAPHFGTVALILILFEGGLDLEFEQAMRQATSAALLGIVYFVICTGGTFAALLATGGFNPHSALLAAFVLAGTSPTVLFPVVSMLSISKELKVLLTLETALTEVLTVVSVVIFLRVVKSPHALSIGAVATDLLLTALLSLIVAFAAGLLWFRLMRSLSGEPLSYMITLGMLFVLYAGAHYADAEPALTVLFFGLFLGNAHWILSRVAPKLAPSAVGIHDRVKTVNLELSFLVRTFFFVFMGMLFNFSNLTPLLVVSATLTLAVLTGGRWLAIRTVWPVARKLRAAGALPISIGMISRGLACAVMALTAAKSGLPGAEICEPLAFLTILATNLVMAGFIYSHETRVKTETMRAAEQPSP